MTVTLRPYRPRDAAAVVDLWHAAVGDPFPLQVEVLRQCVEGDPNHRPSDAAVAIDRRRVVGFAYASATRDPDPRLAAFGSRVHLQAVVVAADHRREGVGTQLVGAVVASAPTEGRTVVEAGSGFFYLWPGFPMVLPDAAPFFASLGFRDLDVTYDLLGRPVEVDASAREALDAAHLRVETATPADRDALLAYVYAEFGGEWWHDIRRVLDQGSGVRSFLVVRASDGSPIGHAHLHRESDTLVGPPLFWADALQRPAGGVGSIGVAAAVRGRGVGRALLATALERLGDEGIREVVIDFTTQLAFYGQFGFVPWRTYRHASASIGDVLAATAGARR